MLAIMLVLRIWLCCCDLCSLTSSVQGQVQASQKELVSLAHVYLEPRMALEAALPSYKGFFGLYASVHEVSKGRNETAGEGREKDPLQRENCPNVPVAWGDLMGFGVRSVYLFPTSV